MDASFRGPSPYDEIVEKAATTPQEDWTKIMAVCDRVEIEQERGSKNALRAIVKQINNPADSVAAMAVVILDACFINGGKAFQIECAQQPLVDEICRLLALRTNTPQRVCLALKAMLQRWVVDYGSSPPLHRLCSTYQRLKDDGHEFPKIDKLLPGSSQTQKMSPGLNVKEEADLVKAIAESLKDTERAQETANATVYPSMAAGTDGAGRSTAPQTKDVPLAKAQRKIRALYTFKAEEEGELGVEVGQVANLVDSSHPDWWTVELDGQVGLVPSSYVEMVEMAPAPQPQPPVHDKEVDPAVVDLLLEKLLSAQANPADTSFSAEIEQLYERVASRMWPKVKEQLDVLTTREVQLSQLSESYHMTKALYLRLMKDGELASAAQGGSGQYQAMGYDQQNYGYQ